MREQATQVTYSSIRRQVTITFGNGMQVVMPLKDALRLGNQLVNLIRPIEVEVA